MDLRKIWIKESGKRIAFNLERDRCDRNWLIHKARLLKVFHEFALLTRPGTFWHVVDSTDRQERTPDEPLFLGEDSVVLTEMDRLTPRASIYSNGKSKHVIRAKEAGGSLVVHYRYSQALIQVFFTPPRMDGALRVRPDILFCTSRNTDDLTEDFAAGLIAKFLVFCRVESSFQKASFWEKARVRWWKYMDIRNREQVYGEYFSLFNTWEAKIIASAIALATLILGWLAIAPSGH